MVGEAHEIPLAEGDSRLEVTLPSGATRWYGEDRLAGRKTLRYGDTPEAGFYRVATARAGRTARPRPASAFAVNVDTAESDLTPVDPKRLQALIHPTGEDKGGAPPRRRVELWHALGAILLALLLVEGLLAVK
jgi:hypothetical protein